MECVNIITVNGFYTRIGQSTTRRIVGCLKITPTLRAVILRCDKWPKSIKDFSHSNVTWFCQTYRYIFWIKYNLSRHPERFVPSFVFSYR